MCEGINREYVVIHQHQQMDCSAVTTMSVDITKKRRDDGGGGGDGALNCCMRE